VLVLERTVWLLWLQGWDQAPWLALRAAESWEINNPTWNVERLSLDNLGDYVSDVEYIYDQSKTMSPQWIADIVRVSLLKNHGGLWADATMFCMQPLDPWVHDAVAPAGIWMYHGRGAGMSAGAGPTIWMIASQRDSLAIDRWKRACDDYWARNSEPQTYFWLDGLFRELYESDAEFRNTWLRAPYLYCDTRGQAHTLARGRSMFTDTPSLKRIFRDRPPYALKLWWGRWERNFPDVDSEKCRASNAYYAIQMSTRRVTYIHPMRSKDSRAFRAKIRMQDIGYAVVTKLKPLVRVARRWLRRVKH
jgi:hypothetical protein